MKIVVKPQQDKIIVQIGLEEEIREQMQEKTEQLYKLQSPLKDFSLHYPFEVDQLEEWKTILDWEEVSSNMKVKWTEEVIRKFQDRWNWIGLGFNTSILCWDAELLEELKDKINWELLVSSSSISWTKELHNRFEEYLPSYSSYDSIIEHTTGNRKNYFRSPDNKLSEPFLELYLFAKSIDEEQGIFILFDSIQEYFDSIKEINN